MTPTVLVVDDNDLLLKVIHHLLSRAGYTTIASEGRTDVVRLIGQHQPDLVILDLELGMQSGLDIVEKVRSDPATVDLPLIVYSGNPFVLDPAAPRLRALGCSLLDKPLRLDDMLKRVHDLIGTPASQPEMPVTYTTARGA